MLICSNYEKLNIEMTNLQVLLKSEKLSKVPHNKVVALEWKLKEEGDRWKELKKELNESKRKIAELQGTIDRSEHQSLNAPVVAQSLGRIIRVSYLLLLSNVEDQDQLNYSSGLHVI